MADLDLCRSKALSFIKETNPELAGDVKKIVEDLAGRIKDQESRGLTKAEQYKELNDHIENTYKPDRTKMSENRILDLAKQQQIMDIVKGSPKKTWMKSFIDYIAGGANDYSKDGSMNPIATRAYLHERFMSTLYRGLEMVGVKDQFQTGLHNKNIFIELDNLRKGLPHSTGDEIAVKIAKVIRGFTDEMFSIKKNMLPNLKQDDGYLIKRYYDQDKTAAMSFNQWMDVMRPAFWDKSFPNAPNASSKLFSFRQIYNNIKAGREGSIRENPITSEQFAKDTTTRNVSKQVTQERALIASSPEEEHNVFDKLGSGNMELTLQRMANESAMNLSVIDKLGSDPYGNASEVIRRLHNTSVVNESALRTGQEKGVEPTAEDLAQADKLFKERGDLSDKGNVKAVLNRIRNLTGETDVSPNTEKFVGQVGQLAQNMLGLKYAAINGATFFRMFSDIPRVLGRMKDVYGNTMSENAVSFVKQVFENLPNTEAKHQLAGDLKMTMNDTIGAMAKNYGVNVERRGTISALAKMTGALGLSNQLHDSLKLATARFVSKSLGRSADLPFNELPTNVARELNAYGIGPAMWDMHREGAGTLGVNDPTMNVSKNTKFITADSIRNVPDSSVASYLQKIGMPSDQINPATISKARQDSELRFGTMIMDNARQASAFPGLENKARLNQGTSINDPAGILLRIMGQFHGASLEVYDSYKRNYEANGGGKSGLAAAALTAGITSFFGMIGYACHHFMVSGQLPDPKDPAIYMQGIMQSGVGSLYMDNLYSAYGSKTLEDAKDAIMSNALGPVGSDVAGAAAIAGQYAHWGVNQTMGDQTKKAPNMEAFNLLRSYIPGQNLFYTQGLLNYHVINGFKEAIHNGYLNRLEINDIKNGTNRPIFKPGGHGFWGTE